MFQNKREIIPGMLTLSNLTCGYLSIVYASRGEFAIAGYLILASAFFDLIDGLAARLLKAASNFGVQLDSLADIIGFGAPTAFLIYKFKLEEMGTWGLVISVLFIVAGALRLARFNTEVNSDLKKHDFKGIPIPVAALVITLMILAQLESYLIPWGWKWFYPVVTVIASAGMVSSLKFPAFPKPSAKFFKYNPVAAVLIVATPFAVWFYGVTGLFITFIFGILYNLLQGYVSFLKIKK